MSSNARKTNTTRRRNTSKRNRRVTTVRERVGRMAERWRDALRRAVPMAALFGLMAMLPPAVLETWSYLERSPYFAVNDVRIEGNRQLSRAHIEAIAFSQGGGNLLRLDERKLADALRDTGWVREVSVRRVLPNTVEIQLEEFAPVATLLAGGAQAIDRGGERFRTLAMGETIPRPVITGLSDGGTDDGLIRDALKLADYYERAGMNRFDPLAAIHHDASRGFSLLTEQHQLVAHMGHDGFVKRIRRLRFVVDDAARRGIGIPGEVHCDLAGDRVVVSPGTGLIAQPRVDGVHASAEEAR